MGDDHPMATVRVEVRDGLGWVVFDNPARRNALTSEMSGEAVEIAEALASDGDVRAIVLRGAGDRAFVSGADITAFGSRTDISTRRNITDEFVARLRAMDKPVIAALRGWCLGAGTLLALAADVRIAGDDARIGIPAAKLGIAYPHDAVARLVEVVGDAVASELLFTGEPLTANDALRVGLVNHVVPADDLFTAAADLAAQLAANAPLSIAAAKRAIAAALHPGDGGALAASRTASEACFASTDFVEGRQAFAEKRPPVFTGR